MVLNALRETETALNVYAHDLERQQRLAAARAQAASAGSPTTRRLQAAGRIGAAPTLDAQRTLASADLALAVMRAQLAQDQVALFLALGGGWEKN